MKILFITDNFPPEVNAPATRTFDHCKEWQKLGAEVTVLTCFPNFPTGKVFEGYKNKFKSTEYIEGIKVVRMWSYISANQGFFRRIIDFQSFAFMSFFFGLFIKSDIIIATSPQFFTTISAYFLALIKRKPWVFELRDLWPESIISVGAMNKSFLISVLEKLELYLYKKSTCVVSVTESFKKNLEDRGIDSAKIYVIPNGCNKELFFPKEKNTAILKDLNLKGKFVIGYIGTHGMAHSLEFIIDSIQSVMNDDIHFLFIGDGAEKNSLMDKAKALKLQNVTFLASIEKDKVSDYLSVLDISLVPLKKSDTFKNVIPSKIFEAAAMSIPVLLGVEGESKSIIEKHNCGISFEPENKQDFLDKLHYLYDNVDDRKVLKENSKYLSEEYDRSRLAAKMFNIIRDIESG